MGYKHVIKFKSICKNCEKLGKFIGKLVKKLLKFIDKLLVQIFLLSRIIKENSKDFIHTIQNMSMNITASIPKPLCNSQIKDS